MKMIQMGAGALEASAIVAGMMRIVQMSDEEIRTLVSTALDAGITMFDHANIYGSNHRCEERFGEALGWSASQRDKVILQSKVGIREWGWFDFSYEQIISSTEASLRALRTDYLDVLLLHRPDALMEPEEVARAFDELEAAGKVRHFGVSNHTPTQMELLRRTVKQPLIANQLQLSVTHAPIIAEGVTMNMEHPQSVMRADGVVDYCRLTDTTIQAWSPFQAGDGSGPFVGNRDRWPELNEVLDRLAGKYNVTPDAIATAWILRHPAQMQVVLGTTKPERIQAAAAASHVVLSREEWYEIFRASEHIVP